MSRMILQRLQQWRDDVIADMDELRGLIDWLDDQIEDQGGKPPPSDRPRPRRETAQEPVAEPPEPPATPGPAVAAKSPYVRTTPEQIRDVVRDGGRMSVRDVANTTGASATGIKPKLDAWVANGTMQAETISGKTVYSIKGIEHPPYRALTPVRPKRLRLVTGATAIPKTGRMNPKRMKRQGKIKGVGKH